MEFNRFLEYYSNAPEIETPSKKDQKDADKENKRKNHGSDKEKTSRKAEEGYARLFLNMGKSDGFFATQIIDMINRHTKRVEIGRIDLMQNFSFFEVLEDQAKDVIKALNKVNIKGRKVIVELAGENNGKSDKSGKKQNRKEDTPKKERKSDKASKPSKANKEPQKEKKVKPSREERGYTEARGPKKKDDWKKFFAPENSKWLKGEEPNFEEEGWARRKSKKR
jgi:ATP-dependent RNA helicase DeaD